MTPLRAVACALLACASFGAQAHDSWLVPTSSGFEVVTGARYPRIDLKPPPQSIARAGPDWVELREFDITLDDKLVDVYLREAQPSQEVRERWQRLHARGVPWQERYRKFMRIEGAQTGSSPVGLDLEFVAVGGGGVRAGDQARFVALSNGKPVAGLAVELVSERSPLGAWSRTNGNGEVEWQLPFAGRWLVRSILIEPDGETKWASRFATFAFEAR
jgi:hypothetical protein